jgi:hypothetical protein
MAEEGGRAWRRGRTFAIDPVQAAAFMAGLARGESVAAAAKAAGVAVSTLYHRRRTSPSFALAWAGAAALGARPMLVLGHDGRKLMRKKGRAVRFDEARKQTFLDHFAGSCNLAAAAAAANASPGTVYRHLRNDPAFAAGLDEALAIGYRLLEGEAAAQVRAAQAAYRIDPKAPEAAPSFEQALKLLHEYKRGAGRIGRRPTDGRLSRWSFDEAMTALEKRLRHFGTSDRTSSIGDERGGGEEGGAGKEEAPPPADGRPPSPGNPGEDLASEDEESGDAA